MAFLAIPAVASALGGGALGTAAAAGLSGAALGAAGNKAMGGDWKRGAMIGGLGAMGGAGLSGLLGGAGAGTAAGNAAALGQAGTEAATLAMAEPLAAGALGSAGGATTAGSGLGAKLGSFALESGKQGATNLAAGAATNAMMPEPDVVTPGQPLEFLPVPDNQSDEMMRMLMQKMNVQPMMIS